MKGNIWNFLIMVIGSVIVVGILFFMFTSFSIGTLSAITDQKAVSAFTSFYNAVKSAELGGAYSISYFRLSGANYHEGYAIVLVYNDPTYSDNTLTDLYDFLLTQKNGDRVKVCEDEPCYCLIKIDVGEERYLIPRVVLSQAGTNDRYFDFSHELYLAFSDTKVDVLLCKKLSDIGLDNDDYLVNSETGNENIIVYMSSGGDNDKDRKDLYFESLIFKMNGNFVDVAFSPTLYESGYRIFCTSEGDLTGCSTSSSGSCLYGDLT